MNEHLRQRGRTERMLADAVSWSAQGRQVCVFVHAPNYVENIRRRLGDYREKVYVQVIPDEFDWNKMHDPILAPHWICLVDHVAVELHLAKLDERIMRLQQLARQLYHLTT